MLRIINLTFYVFPSWGRRIAVKIGGILGFCFTLILFYCGKIKIKRAGGKVLSGYPQKKGNQTVYELILSLKSKSSIKYS